MPRAPSTTLHYIVSSRANGPPLQYSKDNWSIECFSATQLRPWTLRFARPCREDWRTQVCRKKPKMETTHRDPIWDVVAPGILAVRLDQGNKLQPVARRDGNYRQR